MNRLDQWVRNAPVWQLFALFYLGLVVLLGAAGYVDRYLP